MFKRLRLVVPIVLFTGALVALSPLDAFAATAPNLGTALNFTVLAGSTVTNTGPSVITGNLGLDPGSSVTGFPPGTVTGVQHISDAVALQAKNDLSTAYTEAANAPVTTDMTGLNLGGKNLTPGVYKFDSSAQLTGPLTLSGNGIYIFQIGSTLTTASNSVVPDHQRRSGVRCLLAGGQLGHARLGHPLSGNAHGAHQHHDGDRREHHQRSRDGTQRRVDPGRQ